RFPERTRTELELHRLRIRVEGAVKASARDCAQIVEKDPFVGKRHNFRSPLNLQLVMEDIRRERCAREDDQARRHGREAGPPRDTTVNEHTVRIVVPAARQWLAGSVPRPSQWRALRSMETERRCSPTGSGWSLGRNSATGQSGALCG